MPAAKVGQPFQYQLQATQPRGIANAAVVYEIDEGALPPGLALNRQSGEIVGIPNKAGTFVVTVRAVGVSARNPETLLSGVIWDLLTITITVAPAD